MSEVSDLGLDLESLFQPAWAKGKAETNRFEKFTGNEGVKPERRGGDRFGGGGRPGPRRDSMGMGGGRPGGDRPRPGGNRPGAKFGDRKKSFGRRDDRGEGRDPRRERPEPPAPLPEITVTFLPDEKGVEQLARQIRMTGRAYPLFQIAQLVLEKPERYSVQLGVKKKSAAAVPSTESGEQKPAPDAVTVAQPLFACALDDTPWLSAEEVVQHVLKNHFATFYQAERTPTDPPKGTYTFVAQCGMSGIILGPPNYHDYQNQLRKLHAERFSRMPFDAFKARVKIVKDEAVVKKWIEDQSFKTEYTALNVPEPLKLPSMEEVEKHFRATHKDTIVKQVENYVVNGVASRNLKNRDLYRLIRTEWENQKHFPLQLAMLLSKQFTSHGLQFFKVNKTVVHVSVARPQFLDLETTPVSEQIRRIVEFINNTPKSTRRKMIETLAPTPKPAVLEVKPDEPKAEGAASVADEALERKPEPTPEQTALIADLHWLIHQGHVLEFADGRIETAKRPVPKPPKPEAKPEQKPEAGAAATETGAVEVKSEEAIATEPVSEKAPASPAPSDATPGEAVPSPS